MKKAPLSTKRDAICWRERQRLRTGPAWNFVDAPAISLSKSLALMVACTPQSGMPITARPVDWPYAFTSRLNRSMYSARRGLSFAQSTPFIASTAFMLGA